MHQIGILQLTQHLDDAVAGFKHRLSQLTGEAAYQYVNADGNLAALPALAAKLAEGKAALIFACSTPAALAAVQLPAPIPVVFTPVFDPVGSGLVDSLPHPGGKATGVSGMVPAAKKVAFINRLLPAARSIGVLYHSEDANALTELQYFRTAAAGVFHLAELPVHRPEDLSRLPEFLPAGLDALFLPIGRIVEENFATIAYYTDTLQLPVIASHAPNVPEGAVAALVANHYQLGMACAEKAVQILKGAAPATLSVGVAEQPEIHLNKLTAANLGLPLADDLLAEAKEIFE